MIPQQQQEVQQVQNNLQVEEENMVAFPIPHLPDLIGEEIPLDQLIQHVDEIQEPDEEDDMNIQVEHLVGPGEEGFPLLNNGGMQLPPNLTEEALIQLADEHHNGQPLHQEAVDVIMQEQEQQAPLQMGQEQHDQPPPEQAPIQNNHQLQIGMALIPETQWETTFQTWDAKRKEKEMLKLWENLFCQGNTATQSVTIPLNWIPFFANTLSSTEKSKWAKEFMLSGAVIHLDENNSKITLPVPKADPSKSSISNPLNIIELDNDNGDAEKKHRNECNTEEKSRMEGQILSIGTGENKRKKTTKGLTPIVDTQVCRSERVRQNNNGFKSSEHSHKKCSSCNPPTLSTNVIRSLGVQFCSMDPEELTDDKLLKKGEKRNRLPRKKANQPTTRRAGRTLMSLLKKMMSHLEIIKKEEGTLGHYLKMRGSFDGNDLYPLILLATTSVRLPAAISELLRKLGPAAPYVTGYDQRLRHLSYDQWLRLLPYLCDHDYQLWHHLLLHRKECYSLQTPTHGYK